MRPPALIDRRYAPGIHGAPRTRKTGYIRFFANHIHPAYQHNIWNISFFETEESNTRSMGRSSDFVSSPHAPSQLFANDIMRAAPQYSSGPVGESHSVPSYRLPHSLTTASQLRPCGGRRPVLGAIRPQGPPSRMGSPKDFRYSVFRIHYTMYIAICKGLRHRAGRKKFTGRELHF